MTGDATVGNQGAGGDLEKSSPNLELKIGSLDQKGVGADRTGAGFWKDRLEKRRGLFGSVLDCRTGPASRELVSSLIPGSAGQKLQSTDSSVCDREQTIAKGARVDSVADHQVVTEPFQLPWGHRLDVDHQIVQTSTAREAGIPGGFENAVGL